MSKFKESLSQTIRKQLHERAVREHQKQMLLREWEEDSTGDEEVPILDTDGKLRIRPPGRGMGRGGPTLWQWGQAPTNIPGGGGGYRTPRPTPPTPAIPPIDYSPGQQPYKPWIPWVHDYSPFSPGYNAPANYPLINPSVWPWNWNWPRAPW